MTFLLLISLIWHSLMPFQALPFPGPGMPAAAGAGGPTLCAAGTHGFLHLAGTGATTTAVDTSGCGANSLIVVAWDNQSSAPVIGNISDSVSNTYNFNSATFAKDPTTTFLNNIAWCYKCTLSATFTITRASPGNNLFFAVFKNVTTSGTNQGIWLIGTTYAAQDIAFDNIDNNWYVSKVGSNTANIPHLSPTQWALMNVGTGANSGTAGAPGSLTTWIANNIAVTILDLYYATTGVTPVVPSGCTATDIVGEAANNVVAGGMAYCVVSSPGAINPNWTWSAGTGMVYWVANQFFF